MAVKKIIIKGEDLVIRKEGYATAAITPGDLVTAIPGGAVTALASAASAVAQTAFAVENEVVGMGIATAYATDDTVLYAVCPPGVEIYARAVAAVTAGAALESSATAGQLQAVTTGKPIARAIETTGGAGRIKVEVL